MINNYDYDIFTRAGLLLHLERYQEALVELEELRQIAPKESLVYYLLSKVSHHRVSNEFASYYTNHYLHMNDLHLIRRLMS
jgi:hypothetical protein